MPRRGFVATSACSNSRLSVRSHTELRGNGCEGEAVRVPLSGITHHGVGHLARVASPLDSVALQVADHGGAVDPVLSGETVDGLPVDVPGHDLGDLTSRQPALLLSGTPGGWNVLVLGSSADHLFKRRPQLVFRE